MSALRESNPMKAIIRPMNEIIEVIATLHDVRGLTIARVGNCYMLPGSFVVMNENPASVAEMERKAQ